MARLAYRKTPAHDPRFVEEGLMPSRLLILLVPAAMLLQTGVGYADAIDGDWCSTDGMRMAIHGEKITIPSGKQIEGNYSRHAFDYVVPAGESGSGDVVSIILRSEYLALSRQGPVEAPLREWHRCKESIS
jgi:transposase InsO family protein